MQNTVPVVIVGAGPVGLVASILLSRQRIPHRLVEKRDRISELPRARGLTTRSVEILSQMGLGVELEQIAQSALWSSAFVYTETLSGALIGSMPGAMAPGAAAAYSAARYIVAAQDRIDPMLYEAAVGYRQLEIRFDTEAIGLEQDADGVTLTVRGNAGVEEQIRAQYVIAADGGRSPLRALAGIGETGRANLRSFINNFVKADLSKYTEVREGALIWTLKPGAAGVFQMLDEKERWAIQVQYDPECFDLAAWTDAHAKRHLRDMLGVSEEEPVEIEILRAYGYTISMMLADKLVEGRLLLAGDAAHQIPPYGGFGLNTGLQAAHNLAWKVGAVLRGEAPPALLDTYDAERREVARRVIAFGAANAGYIEQMMAAVRDAQSLKEKRAVLQSTKQYGNWWGLDLGVHYEGPGAYVSDDVAPPAVENPVIDYTPHAKPGWRAPHFWITKNGARMSILALLHTDFVLLAGPEGHGWITALHDAAAPIAPSITGYRVAADGQMTPEETDFCALYGVGPRGAVLVRPDGMVGFRALDMAADPGEVLKGVLDAILQRQRPCAAP